jgi:hypothetical protein
MKLEYNPMKYLVMKLPIGMRQSIIKIDLL